MSRPSSKLRAAFQNVDQAKLRLTKAEQALKAQVKTYAAQNGMLATPRPETVRAQLGI